MPRPQRTTLIKRRKFEVIQEEREGEGLSGCLPALWGVGMRTEKGGKGAISLKIEMHLTGSGDKPPFLNINQD